MPVPTRAPLALENVAGAHRKGRHSADRDERNTDPVSQWQAVETNG